MSSGACCSQARGPAGGPALQQTVSGEVLRALHTRCRFIKPCSLLCLRPTAHCLPPAQEAPPLATAWVPPQPHLLWLLSSLDCQVSLSGAHLSPSRAALFPGCDMPSHDLKTQELPRSWSLFPNAPECLMACCLAPPSGALTLGTRNVGNEIQLRERQHFGVNYPEPVPLCSVGIIGFPPGPLRVKPCTVLSTRRAS